MRKNTSMPVTEQVWRSIKQYEDNGASASEISAEILIPTTTVLEALLDLSSQGLLRPTNIRRPWKHNVSESQAPIRQVWVAKQCCKEAS
jgi:DNA-binding IclR family transcriptional regulator